MKRYVIFDKKRGFYVSLNQSYDSCKSIYSKDINKAALFRKEVGEMSLEDDDKLVEVKVDIRLA